MNVFMLCEQAVGLVRGKRLILSGTERNYLENLNYDALIAAHSQDEAVVCALHFESVRDSLLQLYPWLFARKLEIPPELSPLNNISGWRYAYLLPNDLIKILAVTAYDKRVDFYDNEIEDLSKPPALIELIEYSTAGEYLYTNRSPVRLQYQAKITDVNKWDAAFRDVFVIKLAEAIALAVRGDASVIQGLENSATQIIQAAIQNGLISADTGLQKQHETPPISEYGNAWLEYSGIRGK